MHIEDLKRWHWLLISVVIGLALSMVYSSTAAEGGGGERRTIGPQEFLGRFGQTTKDKSGADLPIFRNVKVYPPVEAKQVVTMDELIIAFDRTTRARSGEYQQRQFVAEIPFVVNRRAAPKDANFTIIDELNQRKSRNAKLTFTYVAWASKPWVYAICTGGSVLLIGLIWPTLLATLQGAGFAAPKRAKDPHAFDLSQVRSYKPEPARVQASGPTAQDMQQLAAVTSQYERSVGGMKIASGEPAMQGSQSGAAVVESARKWETAPVEPTTITQQQQEQHEYGGEFYPVDRGAKKKE